MPAVTEGEAVLILWVLGFLVAVGVLGVLGQLFHLYWLRSTHDARALDLLLRSYRERAVQQMQLWDRR